MKSYIQSELVGDEDDVVIDCAILECLLQEAVFDALINTPTNKFSMEEVDRAIYNVLAPYRSNTSSGQLDLQSCFSTTPGTLLRVPSKLLFINFLNFLIFNCFNPFIKIHFYFVFTIF